MSTAQAAPDDDGCWYMPRRTEQAHRKRIERWLHAHPRVKVRADEILDFVCDVSDDLKEAQLWVKEALWRLEYYLLVFPDKEVADNLDSAMWTGGYVAGRQGSSDPKGVIFPPRAEIEAWVTKEGGIVPLPAHPAIIIR